MTTQSLFLSETQISQWHGVAVYTFNSGRKTTALVQGYEPSSSAMNIYEVSNVTDQGSWWLSTAISADIPDSWWSNGGAEPLAATDIPTTLNGSQVMRPTLLYWWMPSDTLGSQSVSPTIISGEVTGEFPLIAPTSLPPDTGITVVQTANGVTVTVPPQSSDTTIQITT